MTAQTDTGLGSGEAQNDIFLFFTEISIAYNFVFLFLCSVLFWSILHDQVPRTVPGTW